MKAKVGIIGFGFVGDAIKHGLEYYGQKDIRLYDPYKFPDVSVEIIKDTDICFVCVPTPMGAKGQMDKTAIIDCLDRLLDLNYGGLIVIKSTITPKVADEILRKYDGLRIVMNPEFLTQRRAREDFIGTRWMIIGGRDSKDKNAYYLGSFYTDLFPNCSLKITYAHGAAAMMAKYMTNSFFAVKIALMNEFYHLWEALGVENSGLFSEGLVAWSEVVKAFKADDRISSFHTEVPGPDGDKGFGGKCLSKDLNAMAALANELGIPNYVMKGAWEDNKIFRERKDWLEIEWAVTKDYEDS